MGAALARGYDVDAEGKQIVDKDSKPIFLSDADKASYGKQITEPIADADRLNTTYGAGSAARIIATALTGAASGNVTGGLTELVQAAAVNVLQSLTVTEVKHLADSLGARDDQGNLLTNDDDSVIQTTESETVRTLLQGLVGCAGGLAGGSSDCGSAATGAAASVVVNLLINSIDNARQGDQEPRYDAEGNLINSLDLEDQQARSNLVCTIIGGIAEAAGLDTSSAVSSAQIETQNSDIGLNIPRPLSSTVPCGTKEQCATWWATYFTTPQGKLLLAAAKGDTLRA